MGARCFHAATLARGPWEKEQSKRVQAWAILAFGSRDSSDNHMSQVFHGVVVRGAEAEIRARFETLKSRVAIRLVRLEGDVFGIYASRRGDGSGDLDRIASELSLLTGAALLIWYDSRVGDGYRLFERGELTREVPLGESTRAVWGKSDPLDSLGAPRHLHQKIEDAFLYEMLESLAVQDGPARKWH
jgi:hypothetical protein